jgi:hypothetical protein
MPALTNSAWPGPASPNGLNLSGRVVVLGWWAIYLLLSPFYVFSSGTPQPADLFLVAFSPIVLVLLRFCVHVDRDLLLIGLAFLMWIAAVNAFWWMQHYSSDFLIATLFYAYNMMVFFCAVLMHRKLEVHFITTTRIILIILVGVQTGLLVISIYGGEGFRQTGTFNNPNQLGYWSLLIGCCLVVLRGRDPLTTSDMFALLGCGYIAVASLSRAATYAFFILLAIAVAFQGLSRRGVILFLTAAAALTVLWSANPDRIPGITELDVVERFNKRLEFRQDQDALGGARGYERMFAFPEHLILGAGEGQHVRFGVDSSMEFHSTFGTLVFHYGVVGFSLFALLLARICRRAHWGHIALLAPIALYGLTHQGLRFTLFWIFLGLVVAMSERARQGEVGSAQQRPATWLTSGRGWMVRRGG